MEEIKSFISSLLAQARQEEREKIADELYHLMPIGEVSAFDLIKRIEGYRRYLFSPPHPKR